MASQFGSEMSRTMTEEQFYQVVDAILNGKYSWACLLILQFAGYNPLHYIPYRTYNRLMKENNPKPKKRKPETSSAESNPAKLDVDNLPHLASIEKASSQIEGGSGQYYCPTLTNLYHWYHGG